MAKKWVEVASSPAYQALAPEQQEAARSQYWNEVIAPQVPEQERDTVRQQFDADTSPTVNWQGGASMEIAITGGQLEPEKASDPTEGMSTLQKMAAGAGKSVVDTYRGAKQFATQGLLGQAAAGSTLARKAGLNQLADLVDTSAGRNLLASLTGQQAAINESKRLDAPLMDTKAGIAGNALGYLGQLAAGGIALRGTSLVGAALPRTVAGNALQGAGLGALQPVATSENRLANIAVGTAGGAGGALAGKAIGSGVNALARLLRPATLNGADRAAGQIIQREAARPADLATPQPSAVPGVRRTLAEETLDPGLAGLERNARRGGARALFDDVDRQNNAARAQAVRQFAGDDAAMQAAEASRNSVTSSMRNTAMQSGPVDSAPALMAIDDLIAQQQGRPAVQAGLQQVRSLLEREAAPGAFVPEDRIAVLDNARKTIGDMLDGKYGGDNAAALAGSRELIQARQALDAVMGPEYNAYLGSYRAMSAPINRMELGQSLLESRTGSAILDPVTGEQVFTPAAFSRAARDLDSVAQRATGFNKARAADILEPEDLQTIANIQRDLERRAFTATAGSPGGSQTAEAGMLEGRLQSGLSSYAARLPWVGGFVERAQELGAQRVQDRLGYLLANPEEARRVLASLSPAQRTAVQQALADMARFFPGSAAGAGAGGTAPNAGAPPQLAPRAGQLSAAGALQLYDAQ
ncbi:hypothetical protein [Xanthomonas citri]|uniref:hypothetical protein n=1 Tax=Xanthomonas citri TaxID=346 RepID=UPI000B5CC3B3|nr:hypothetical protein [Xanthomonas citri]ASL01755.1 hypothetical protein XcvCFBP7113P_16665 [Xanthomonas citri pv. vignicola]